MRQHDLLRKYILPTLLLFLSLSVVQCGGDSGISSQIDYTIDPERPVVIDTDFTIRIENGDGDPDTFETKEVKAPWFLFGYDIKNNSDKTITIVNFKITVTGTKQGKATSSEHTLDLDDLGTNVTYLEEIGPGKKASRFTDTRWFMHTLPEDVDGFSYTVKVEVQGWVGKSDSPDERLSGTFNFSTQ